MNGGGTTIGGTRRLVGAAVIAVAAAVILMTLSATASAASPAASPASGGSGSPAPASPATAPSSAATAGQAAVPVPVLAYFYIWFDPSSWNRAKIDYPALGRYSSDDVTIMRRQISLAKKAGIDGFLVGWKEAPHLDHRLAALVKAARQAHFKLGLVFQGLDFSRKPLPMTQVRRSFAYFTAHYAKNPAFDLFGKPVVIWSGTWMYTRKQMASVTSKYGDRLTILASEKHPDDYKAVAGLFAGDAYYWSSVDPLTTPGYEQKLQAFAETVHREGGLWFAPAAPGFDARLIGGSRVIPRRDGETLKRSMEAALSSSPDAIAVISWNEYSENTMVEPSRKYGSTALKVIAAIQHADAGAIPNFDSSGPPGFSSGPSQLLIPGAMVLVLVMSATVIVLRTTRGRP